MVFFFAAGVRLAAGFLVFISSTFGGTLTTNLGKIISWCGCWATGSASGSASGPEVTLLKQQFETVKQTVIQTKGATVTIVKDNKELKNQVDSLKNELTETRELLTALQNLTMDNSQKIMELSSGDFQNVDEQFFQTDQGDNDYNTLIGQTDSSEIQDLQEDSGSDEIVGTNLKELIESEINADL